MMHPLSPELRSSNNSNEKEISKRRAFLPNNVSVHPNLVVATIAGIQVMRALWQIWDAIENHHPGSIDDIITPTVYISCILSTTLMITSAIATWSAYKFRIHALHVCWWLFYVLTLFSFLNNCTSLSIISLSKKEFMKGCIIEAEAIQREGCGKLVSEDVAKCNETVSIPNFQECHQLWEDSVVWSAVIAMVDLLINLGFAFALYKCRAQSRLDEHSFENQVHPGITRQHALPPYSDESSTSSSASSNSGSDGFRTVGFNKH